MVNRNGRGKRAPKRSWFLLSPRLFLSYVASSVRDKFPLATGDFVEYRIEGKLNNVSMGAEFIFYFTENYGRGQNQYIVTISPSSGMQQAIPFVDRPMLESQYFHYDGKNLFAIGELLASASSHYDGANISDLPQGSFGTFVDYQNFQRPDMPYTNGESVHYTVSDNGATLEQWVVNGTGLPIKVTYSDTHGTLLSLSLTYTNVEWIERLTVN
jgi:hypothetical protein